jgi:hypothetical protein
VNARCWNSARHKYSYWRRLSQTLVKIWIVTATLFQGQTHRYEDTMRTWNLYRGVYQRCGNNNRQTESIMLWLPIQMAPNFNITTSFAV